MALSTAAVLFLGATNSPIEPVKDRAIVTIAGAKLDVKVADTSETQTRGLSGRDFLADNEGMLFIFPESSYRQFWMKDMLIPIDIIWLDQNYRVIDILPSVSPETYPQTFAPPLPAKYVLETAGGWGQKHKIKAGDTADIIFGFIL